MNSTVLDDVLETLGYEGAAGLLRDSTRLTPDSRSFIWHELSDRGGADAAYFSSGVPIVAFALVANADEASVRHRRLWNLGRVPVLLTVDPQSIQAYSCLVGPDREGRADRALLAQVTHSHIDQLLADFSRVSIDQASSPNSLREQFDRKDRVDRRLLRNLRSLRDELGDSDLQKPGIDRIIGRSIFVRYFEDRSILTRELMLELTGHPTLIDVLYAGIEATYVLFDALAQRFNGDVFGFAKPERELVRREDLATIASFFDGTDIVSGQRVFWPYDFGVIPSQLISSIYEQLLEDERAKSAAYYTPRVVVDLILDEVLPWELKEPKQLTIFDPSCGSGIFLTEAFRRLVHIQRATDTVQPTFEQLVDLLQSSIFGVDLSDAATSVAALALYLALLEHVDPPTIWREVRLPPLVGRNLIVSDYFADHQLSESNFDVIVGNPPWKNQLTKPASEFVQQSGVDIADLQIAIAFAYKAYSQLNDGGSLGILLPAKALLHNQSKQASSARLGLLNHMKVDSIIDLSLLRRNLFAGAIAPAAALFAVASEQEVTSELPTEIVHTAPRMSPLQIMVDGFVVAQSDIHFIPRDIALRSPEIWRVLAWGSMADLKLVERLRREYSPLRAIVSERGWLHNRGFQIAGGDENDSEHLVGRVVVEARSVRPFAIVESELSVVSSAHMHRPRDPELYSGTQVLFRIGLYDGEPAATVASDMVFTDSVFGITSSNSADDDLLKAIAAFANSALGRYFYFMSGSSWGIERNYLGSNEFLSLPIARPSDSQIRALSGVVDELTEGHTRLDPQESALDELVFECFGLDDLERQLILDAVEIQLSQFRLGLRSTAFTSASERRVADYSSTLREALADTIGEEHIQNLWISSPLDHYRMASIDLTVSRADHIAGDPPSESLLRRLKSRADELAIDTPSPTIVFQPTFIILDGTSTHLVKPDETRNWTRSIAYDDAARILGAIGRKI